MSDEISAVRMARVLANLYYNLADTPLGRTKIAEWNAIHRFLKSIRQPVFPQNPDADLTLFEFYAELHRLKLHLTTLGYTLSSCVSEETDTRIALTVYVVWAAEPKPEPDEPVDKDPEPMPVGRTCSIQDGSKIFQHGNPDPARLARERPDIPQAGYTELPFPTIFRKPSAPSHDAITWYEPRDPATVAMFGVHGSEEFEAGLEVAKAQPAPALMDFFKSFSLRRV
jgi:hypothetical protein